MLWKHFLKTAVLQMQTEAKNAQCWQHVMTNSAGRVCNQPDAREIAVASLCHSLLARFSRPAAISCGIDRSYKLLGRQLWTVLTLEKSGSPATAIKVRKSRHNSRTKLRMKLLNVQKRDNIESYLRCKFQCSQLSVRCKTDIANGVTHTHTQTNELPYAVAPPLGITS